MARCTSCRKIDAEATWWERTRYKLMFKFFPEDVANLVQEKYTQGFGDGQKTGFRECMNIDKSKEEAFQELLKEGVGIWLQKFEEDKPLDKPLL